MSTTIYRYSNDGSNLGILPYDSAIHDEALDGTDKLTVVSEVNPTKRDRLVWQDAGGVWHEHMVDATKRTHAGKGARTESVCSNSISELFGKIASGTKLRTSVQNIVSVLLAGTRWTEGYCSDFGVVEFELHKKNVRQCLSELCELTGGELVTEIEVGDFGVTKRTARIVAERGRKSTLRQFEYGRNMSSVVREVAQDEVFTAVKGYGAKLSDSDVSDYPALLQVTVESNADLSRWGIARGDGTYLHNYTTYTDDQCTDRQFLIKQCRAVLRSVSKPLIRYEFDTAEADMELWSDVRLGDRIMCVDSMFNPPLELIERVSQIRRNLKGLVRCRIAIGERANPLVKQFRATDKSSLAATGNGTDISSRMPISAPSMGSDESPANEPSSMRVTVPPTKLAYYDGERIDYSGIIAVLYNSDGSEFSTDWYPNGVIPFGELIFPQERAGNGNPIGIPSWQAASDLALPSEWEQPITAYGGMHRMRHASYHGVRVDEYWIPIGNTAILITWNTDRSIRYCIASDTYGDAVVVETVSTDESTGESTTVTSYLSAYLSYTHNEKTVYWSEDTNTAFNFQYEVIEPQVGGKTQFPGDKGAWTAIFGERSNVQHSESVEVQWRDQNGGDILSDAFGIDVIRRPFIGDSASSGGGEF